MDKYLKKRHNTYEKKISKIDRFLWCFGNWLYI
jgi:hypothetical protein